MPKQQLYLLYWLDFTICAIFMFIFKCNWKTPHLVSHAHFPRSAFCQRKRLTAESCLSHSWLQQWDFGSLFHPEETSGSSQIQDHTLRSSEDKTPKSSCNGSCGDREDKENIPEDSSMVSKRFRFDDSLPSPHELVPDLLCQPFLCDSSGLTWKVKIFSGVRLCFQLHI